MVLIWLAALVVLLIFEAVTVGLTAIWFALGSLAALISAAFNAPLWMQFAWFAIISAVTLAFTRPLAVKYLNTKSKATNADRLIGMTCIVREDIDNLAGTGAVFIDGKLWTARSVSGEMIEAGKTVSPVRIEGVKLMVLPVKSAERETAEIK
ncbi:MAG: NfeD family protein [Clostridia bacterium]|nr:NfeD family protein [Clostridia bacterium]